MAAQTDLIVKSNDGLTTLYSGSSSAGGSTIGIITQQGFSVDGDTVSISYGATIAGWSLTPNASIPDYKVNTEYSWEDVLGASDSITVIYYIVPVTETYKHILKDGSKIQVDSAIRDGQGRKIHTTYVMKSELLDLIYPVGTYYSTENTSFNPNTAWGGTWEKFAGGYALVTSNGSNGGDVSAVSANNHIPGQAFQGGLPNITAYWYVGGSTMSAGSEISGRIGGAVRPTGAGNVSGEAGGGGGNDNGVNLDASRSSVIYGQYQTTRASVIPDHIAAVVWHRIA